nr:uncharacterized protein LOC117684540 isoform X2 [Crassostrea gigas]
MNGSKDGNDQLLRAFQESFQSQSFLPLLKEELKCKIQCRRLSKGEGEMKVQFEEQKVYQLTDEEIIKRQKRLSQNRRSAIKRKLKEKLYEEELLAVFLVKVGQRCIDVHLDLLGVLAQQENLPAFHFR